MQGTDAVTQFLWRQVRAKVLARRGEHLGAERLAREAVAAEETDILMAQAGVYADLAEVLSLAGDAGSAAAALHKARGRYERKESSRSPAAWANNSLRSRRRRSSQTPNRDR